MPLGKLEIENAAKCSEMISVLGAYMALRIAIEDITMHPGKISKDYAEYCRFSFRAKSESLRYEAMAIMDEVEQEQGESGMALARRILPRWAAARIQDYPVTGETKLRLIDAFAQIVQEVFKLIVKCGSSESAGDAEDISAEILQLANEEKP